MSSLSWQSEHASEYMQPVAGAKVDCKLSQHRNLFHKQTFIFYFIDKPTFFYMIAVVLRLGTIVLMIPPPRAFV